MRNGVFMYDVVMRHYWMAAFDPKRPFRRKRSANSAMLCCLFIINLISMA